MRILVTGTAGFVGFHLANKLLKDGHTVIGFDNVNDYYNVNLKYSRLAAAGIDVKELKNNTKCTSGIYPSYFFYRSNLEKKEELEDVFKKESIDIVIHLAAQAGVRYSLQNPQAYISSNINGFANILECCRHYNIQHLVYASSSSVYGLNNSIPFKTSDNTDHPISLYAASKKSNELMAHVYSYHFNIPTTGLRFFTIYGPWGRPDMALFIFTDSIIKKKPIQIFNSGKMLRDFTYVDDIVNGVVKAMHKIPVANKNWKELTLENSSSNAPYKIYNVGNNNPVNLLDFVEAIEAELNIKAIKEFLPMQAGDVINTYADITDIKNDFNYLPETSIKDGIKKFINWYRKYYLV